MNTLLLVINTILITLIGFGRLTIQNVYFRLLLSFFVSVSLIGLLCFWSLAGGIRLQYLSGIACVFFIVLLVKYRISFRANLIQTGWSSFNLIFLLALFLAAYRFLSQSQNWGEWDAFSIWNLHAKFLFYPEMWDRVFAANFRYSNNDYPLMLPTFVALGWQIVGKITPVIPAFLSFCVYCGIIGLGFSTIKNRVFAVFFILILLLDTHFLAIAVSQNADTLVAFIYLLSLILFQQSNVASSKSELVFLAGFFAASAVWCKNEGWVFFIVFSTFILWEHFKDKRILLFYLIGSTIFLVTALLFKMLFAPDNYLFREQSAQRFNKLFSMDTYLTIFNYLKNTIWVHYPAILFLAFTLLLTKEKFTVNREWSIIVLTLGGYLAVYLITPFDLKWHLSTSLDRLIHQLYPAAVYLGVSQLEEKIMLPEFNLAKTQNR